MRILISAMLAALAIATGTARADVTSENFMLRTTSDLIALCSVSRNDPNAMAAIHFCEGYYLGLDHFAEAIGRPFRNTLYCPPENLQLTRDQVTGMLVTWHRQNPQFGGEAPLNGIVRWAAATWPCKK
jgi:hypothetical protein